MFKRAKRHAVKLRLALMGPAGSGKTYSALRIAKGLGGRVAMIDTERGSGELYADLHEYDVLQLHPPFSPEKYINAILAAEQSNYDVLIIDSLSHAWAGPGGVLDIQDKVAKSTRNSFSAWREVTPQHNALVDTILASPCHVIATLRTKTAYEVQQDNGKAKVVKVGLAPVQRDGLEYEFTLVLDLAIEGHVAYATKDRTKLFDGAYFTPSEDTGLALATWLMAAPVESSPQQPAAPATNADAWAAYSANTPHPFLMGQLGKALMRLELEDRLEAYSRYVCGRYHLSGLECLEQEHLVEQLALLRQCYEKPERREQFIDILNQQLQAA